MGQFLEDWLRGSFGYRAAAGGAGLEAVSRYREKLQVRLLAARHFAVGVADMVSANSLFSAEFTGTAHIDYLNR